MSELSIGTFLDEVKDEIKLAPKLFHQLQRRDDLIAELRAEIRLCRSNFCEAHQPLPIDPPAEGCLCCDLVYFYDFNAKLKKELGEE